MTEATITHTYKDGTTGPQAKKVPAKIKARLEQILAEARRKQAREA